MTGRSRDSLFDLDHLNEDLPARFRDNTCCNCSSKAPRNREFLPVKRDAPGFNQDTLQQGDVIELSEHFPPQEEASGVHREPLRAMTFERGFMWPRRRSGLHCGLRLRTETI